MLLAESNESTALYSISSQSPITFHDICWWYFKMLRLRVTHQASLSPLIPVLVSALPAVLACLALLTLPASPDALRDLDVVTRVEVVLATRGAVQQVTQLTRAQLGNLDKITINKM